MSKYNRKKPLTEDDEFVEFWTRLGIKLKPYATAIGIALGTALVIVFVVWGIAAHREKKREEAGEMFGRAVRIYDADLITDTNPEKSDELDPIPRFKTEKERVAATLAQLDALDKKFGGSSVADQSLMFRAGILFDEGKYEDAAREYARYLKDAPHDAAVTAVAREGAGLCDEARGKLDDALKNYQELEPKTGDFYRDRALYDQARIYAKKGDKKKAGALYREILEKVPTTALKDEVQSHLADLEGT